MSEPKSFASLSPTLLARKGAARPAMRPQLGPIDGDALARQLEDLGWNDMGDNAQAAVVEPALTEPSAGVVSITPDVPAPVCAGVPEVVRQRGEAARRFSASRRSALADGRRAAFTLRVDAERHLKLRLACAVRNRSAQQLVTDALDQFLSELPDIADLAAQVARRRT
jgi:predicted HicB family RNase H-like nuclease